MNGGDINLPSIMQGQQTLTNFSQRTHDDFRMNRDFSTKMQQLLRSDDRSLITERESAKVEGKELRLRLEP